MIITRKEYMKNKDVTHEQYYSQFVDYEVVKTVVNYFGDRILNSVEPHFNDIPLTQWDQVGEIIKPHIVGLLARANGGGVSKSDLVCTAKMAAEMHKTAYEATKRVMGAENENT
jgi:hypothetical protein